MMEANMVRRESFKRQLKCPQCGKTGVATWEENENPLYTNGQLRPTLEEISKGFKQGKEKDTDGYSEILCDSCNVPV